MPNMVSVDGFYVTSLDMLTAYNNAGELEMMLDELQDSTISNTQENNDVTGKNGAVIGTLKRNKAVTVSGNNGLLVGGGLAAQTGSDVETGSFIVRKTEIVTVNSNSATLTGTPVGAEGAEIVTLRKRGAGSMFEGKYEQDATASGTGKFSYADNTITFFAGDFSDGEQAVVIYDEQVTNAAKISNDADEYSKTLKVYLDVTVTDRCDNLLRGQFQFFRADFTGNFDIALGGTDSAVLSYEFRTLKDLCNTGAEAGKFWDFIVWSD